MAWPAQIKSIHKMHKVSIRERLQNLTTSKTDGDRADRACIYGNWCETLGS